MIIKNPIIDGRYADPEARKYGDKYYIYLTGSKKPLNIDAYSSYDLINWEKHEGIIAIEEFPHVHKCVWAPTVIYKGGKYYIIFASNDIHSDNEVGGLEIAVSDKSEGPFHAFIDKPLIDRFHNGAQPIDAHLFQDDDGTIYLYYGGWAYLHKWIPGTPNDYHNLSNFNSASSYNLLSCEAHFSQAKKLLELCYLNSIEEAKKYAEKIQKLTVMPL